ncbi:MAG: diguanylate cyclase [Clostridiales bacterium]|nr:diguanylate cyclase [Clostridiales bacterium]
MSENKAIDLEQMLNDLPGGLLKIALDDELTIIYATDIFYELIEIDQSKQGKLPKSIFNTVYSSDIINYTQQIAAQRRRKDNQFMLLYRVLQKNGNLKWIMINGNKTEEVYQKQNKTYPIYYCMVMDISEHMYMYRKMEEELDYHRTILELSKELFFEYVIATDTLSFSEIFREVFGKDSQMKEFSKRLEKTKLIHPTDLPEVIKTYKSMMSGKKQARIELQMKTKDGNLAWYVCYASIIFDDNKNPYKVVGKLALINTKNEKKVAPKLSLDSLTQVYTKDNAEFMITENMSNQDIESISALFVCEVRNYKGWNEVVRIVDGENVLVSVANIIKKQFRSTDIIGRLGLSDFVIYMKDISSERNVYKKAESICKEINNLFDYDFNKNGVSISIGVALVKGQADYKEELANAKAALVMAKKDSKSSFEIYYPSINK